MKTFTNIYRAVIEPLSSRYRAIIEPISRDNRVSSHRSILLFALIFIMGIGQMWGADASSANVYYDNTSSAWSDVQIFIGHSTWSVADGMTKLTNSNNLYYKRSYSWGGYSAFYFTTGASGWEGRGENVDTRVTYTTHYSAKKTDNLGSSTWLFISSGGSNGSSVSGSTITGYDKLNYTQTVQQTLSADGGSTYSTSTASLATVKVASYYLSSATATSATATSGTISAGSSSANCKAVRTATVTYTVTGVATGYTFVGWYDGSTQKSTSTTYSYNATEAKTITARFKAEETHDVTVSYKCGSTTIKTATTESAVGVTTTRNITAPSIAGYTFSSWTLGTGITLKSGTTSSSTIGIVTKASGSYTITANYTEDLSSPYVLKGGSAFGGTAWDTEFPLVKKTGHSTESVVYYTATLAAAPSSASEDYNFKIVKKGAEDTWYGLTGDGDWWYQRTTGANQSLSTTGNNIQLRADVAGEYEIKVDYSTPASPKITITFPTVYTLNYAIGTLKGTSGSISTSPTTASGSSVVSGNTVTLTAPAAKAGYTWKGWYTDAAGTSAQQCSTRAYTVTMNANKTLYACYQYESYTVTLNKQTSATGYGTSGSVGNQTVAYQTALPAISGTMPTGATGYGFMGFYTATEGGGEKIIDASGNWVNGVSGYTSADGKWTKTSGVTLYAYYTKPKITAITLTPASGVVAPGGEISATPTIEPTPTGGGSMSVCWKLLHNNGNLYDPQPDMSISSNAVTFDMPTNSGSYKLAAILHTGTGGCGTGEVLDSVTTDVQAAGDHSVTVLYKCGDETIKASEVVTGRPLDWTSITAPTIFGYTFSKWKAGDGITIDGADANGEKTTATINFKAIYDGKLTAIYTQKNVIYFKNTLGWSSVYVNLLTSDYWENTNTLGSGNTGRSNCNLQMSLVPGTTDIYAYEYGNEAVSNYVSFTQESMPNYDNFYQASPNVAHVVYPTRSSDNTGADKATGLGFYAKTPMFVPVEQTAVKKNNNRAEYYNDGYWTKYTPGTGYTLEIYTVINSENVLAKAIAFTSDDELMPMKAVADLEAGKTYKFQLKRDGDVYYGNSGTMTYANHGQETAWEFTNDMTPEFTLCQITTAAAGDYTFILSYSANSANPPQRRLRIAVDYPVTVGDYRVLYQDNVHTKWHPSAVIPRAAAKDTVSFFVRTGKSAVLKLQKCTNISGATVTWADTVANLISTLPSIITKDSVYNFIFGKTAAGKLKLDKTEIYTGNFYIRTDCANSKWDNYRSDPDHLMTYSEYSITHGGYSHYYCHWVQTDDRKNIKFVIANDYSPCISDTLIRETATGAWANVASFITEGGDLLRNANVRFMWDQHTNTISRAYIDGAQGFANDFLVLVSSDSKIADINTAAILSEVKFSDNQNWIYESNVKAKPNAQIKLRSTWGIAPTTIVQYFKGTETTTETLITGSGSDWYDMRLLYDFKTNRLVAAMVPSGNYDDPTAINADVMFIREHQGDIAQITFSDDGEITNIETAYGVIQFSKWTLNNKSKTGSHAPLASPLSPHERGLYFISFPFRVALNDVFGFGTYGTHWIVQYYDGAERAANGYWQGDPGFWKFIWDRKNVFLEPNQGYLLTLDLDLLGEESSVWANDNERAELFFPSYTELSSITNSTVTNTLPSHACTINRAATEGLPDTPDNPHTSYNRTIFDSHWNVMSVPTYVNTAAKSFANTSWITATVDRKTQGPNFLYTWNTDDNTLTPTSGSGFHYQAMHAYMVQYYGNVTWQTSVSPSAIVARRTYANTPKDVEFCLEIQENDKMLDRTYVRLSDDEEVSANFAFNEDMSKDINGRKANIYTLTADNVAVAGNTMPMSDQTISVPVNVKARETSSFTFSIPDGTSGIGVVLVDNETGIRTSLSVVDYTVTLEDGTYSNRFALEISPVQNAATDLNSVESDSGTENVRKVLIDGTLYIIRDEKVYDARGTRVQ